VLVRVLVLVRVHVLVLVLVGGGRWGVFSGWEYSVRAPKAARRQVMFPATYPDGSR